MNTAIYTLTQSTKEEGRLKGELLWDPCGSRQHGETTPGQDRARQRALGPWPDWRQSPPSTLLPLCGTHSKELAKTPHFVSLRLQTKRSETLKRGSGSLQTVVSYVNTRQRTSTFFPLQVAARSYGASTSASLEPSILCPTSPWLHHAPRATEMTRLALGTSGTASSCEHLCTSTCLTHRTRAPM